MLVCFKENACKEDTKFYEKKFNFRLIINSYDYFVVFYVKRMCEQHRGDFENSLKEMTMKAF